MLCEQKDAVMGRKATKNGVGICKFGDTLLTESQN